MTEVHMYFMVVMVAIVSFLIFTVRALMIYQNIWILIYTLIIGVLISAILIAIKPFTTNVN